MIARILHALGLAPRVLDERLYVMPSSGPVQSLAERERKMRFHRDCRGCCRAGRCHWGPSVPSRVAILRVSDGFTYRACVAHADLLYRDSYNVGSQIVWPPKHNEYAQTPAILRNAEGR